ncbi:enoyl-CoA hydratase/isomerase family protein [Bradyrhizobium diazoefficiens]|nr:enoyl-CoA hydratase/isomerase family protein [Bradyrhizobium diazoefficiens]
MDFFTEEYTLNHLIHIYRKPYIVFMDRVVTGGGMGISAPVATKACASQPSARRWRCPRPQSAYSRTWAAAGS